MARRKKEKEEELEVDRRQQIKTSIIAIVVLALGLISLISLISSSGSLGIFLSKNLALAFGWAKWFFSLLLIVIAVAIYKKRNFFPRISNYIGLFLLFLFIPSFFHFFYKISLAQEKAMAGLGGGYWGFYLSLFLKNILGFGGGLIVVLFFLVLSIILLFNITLRQLLRSPQSLFNSIRNFKFFKGEEGEDDEEDDEEEDWRQESLLEEEPEEEEEEEEDLLFTKKKISLYKEEQKEKSEPSPKPRINWKTKKIKIDLPLDLLNDKVDQATSGDIDNNILIIQRTLENFGISVEMGEVNVGPTVTQYTFKPSEGIKVSRITTLNNDLSLALAAHPIRIEAPIPGRSLIGIEVPNKSKAIVGLRSILEAKDFKLRSSNLVVALGKDVAGNSIVYDIAKMPHLLVAGATNSGKSVCLNTLIVSLLYQNNPSDLRFVMVDPKRVELPVYNGIPHLLTPVITEVNKTINALRWCLNEMDRRYEILNQASKKNIQTYNQGTKEKIPYIIFIIDELADLMVAASKDIEASIIRLTQMSRAVGIHLILATQRPSVDVITGLIKANTPSRIAFSVASLVDSKTILDSSGAEKLLGKGDMLFSTAEFSKPKRIQGAYVDDNEILSIVNFIKEKYGLADYLEGIVERQKVSGIAGVGLNVAGGEDDELLEEAKEIVIGAGKASASFLQRRLRIGYSRAASILDALEEIGIIGPPNGSKPREILISKESYENQVVSGLPLHDKKESKRKDDYFYPEEESPLVFEEEEETSGGAEEDELEEDFSEEDQDNDSEEDFNEDENDLEDFTEGELEGEEGEGESEEEFLEEDSEENLTNKDSENINKDNISEEEDDFGKFFSR